MNRKYRKEEEQAWTKEVRIDDIPEARDEPQHPRGRLGELFERIKTLKRGVALEVECRDRVHAGSTMRHMRNKAEKAGLGIDSRRIGNTYYVWLK